MHLQTNEAELSRFRVADVSNRYTVDPGLNSVSLAANYKSIPTAILVGIFDRLLNGDPPSPSYLTVDATTLTRHIFNFDLRTMNPSILNSLLLRERI